MVDKIGHLDEYVEANVKVSTVNKLVGEKSPNLFLLLWVEDQGTLIHIYYIERDKITSYSTFSAGLIA